MHGAGLTMHILLLIVSVLAGAGFWLWRLRMAGQAASELASGAAWARGFLKRRARVQADAFSPVTAIDHPAQAAASWARFTLGEEDWADRRAGLRAFLAAQTSGDEADEAITYAEWLARQPVDPDRAARTLRGRLGEWLDPAELSALDEVVCG